MSDQHLTDARELLEYAAKQGEKSDLLGPAAYIAMAQAKALIAIAAALEKLTSKKE